MEIGSGAWCAAMSAVLADVELPEVQATVEQRIGDGNGGPVVAYRLVMGGGRARLEPVPVHDGSSSDRADGSGGAGQAGTAADAEPPDCRGDGDGRTGDSRRVGIEDGSGVVMMSQSRQTAEAVRRGELGALAALQAGLIKVSGDVRVLIAASEALALVNSALGQALNDGESSASSGCADATHHADRGADGSSGGADGGGSDGDGG